MAEAAPRSVTTPETLETLCVPVARRGHCCHTAEAMKDRCDFSFRHLTYVAAGVSGSISVRTEHKMSESLKTVASTVAKSKVSMLCDGRTR